MDKDQLSQNQLEEIERFLQSEMTHEERAAFLARLSEDPRLQDQFHEMQLLHLGIQEASLEERMDEFHHGVLRNKQNPSQPGVHFYSLRRLLVAASVILLLGIAAWWLLTKAESKETIFAEFFSPDPGLISAMSTSENYSFDRAMIEYKTGNYREAIRTWSIMQSNQPDNDTLNYFLASAFLATNQTGKAIEYFEKVTPSQTSAFLNDTYWYLGLALIKEGDWQRADSLLRLSNHPQKNVLLNRLKK